MAERWESTSSSSFSNMPIHKHIPMENFDLIHPNAVRILYYLHPNRFYVYLPQKIQIHAQFQMELQEAMKNYPSNVSTPSYQRYQPVVAQDHHAVWHRAMILDIHSSSIEVSIYFVDFGQEEKVSLGNIRPLPMEFIRQPAFAIPCRLFGIVPLNSTDWKLNDPVHNHFNQLFSDHANCQVCHVRKEICYDVNIEIPNVGDLGKYLLERKLVSSIQTPMNTNYLPQTSTRIPPGFNDQPQLIPNRILQNSTGQRSPSTPTSTESVPSPSSSLDISSLSAQDGCYIITHVYSASEFYGYSQVREKELEAFQKHLEAIYNHEQSFSVHLPMEGTPCVILYNEKYNRVKIKQRVSDSRVLVKLVDRGEEIVVDTSELLQLEKQSITIPAFAQPFRLFNADELQNVSNVTPKLKRLILNQRVLVTIHSPMIRGFYPVELKLPNQLSINQLLLSNDPLPVIPPPVRPVETSAAKPLRATADLPTPPSLLTSRFQPATQSPQLQPESERPRSTVNGNQVPSTNVSHGSRGFSTERNNGNNYRTGRTNDENNPPRAAGFNNIRRDRNGFSSERSNQENNNRADNFGDQRGRTGFGGQGTGGFNNNRPDNFNEQRGRTGFGGQRTDGFNNNRPEGAPEHRGWNRLGNERNNDENHQQRTGDFNNNRTDSFADRQRGRSGFRGGDRNDEENSGPRRGGFNPGHGARHDFQDRNNRFRNNQDGGNDGNPRFANRGGYNGERRDRNGDGGFPRRGNFADRGNARGGRGGNYSNCGFRDRPDNNFRSNTENDEPLKTFSGWPKVKPPAVPFEPADQYPEPKIPGETFEFAVSHIERSNDFFIQLFSKEQELSTLGENLQKEYQTAPDLDLLPMKVNQACLAKSTDDCWYRAILLKTDKTRSQVRFVDFGDTIELETRTIRQLAKTFATQPPYAYRCMLKNVRANENLSTSTIINRCVGQKFHGRIEKKTSDEKYFLQSDDFQRLMIEIKAVETNQSCMIVYVDTDQQQFFIQNDPDTMDKIRDEVNVDVDLPIEEIQVDTLAIATFEDAPYRAIIQADLGDDVRVYFIDYGNTIICSKNSLKKCPEQLKAYPPQAQRCQLSLTSNQDLDQAYKQLEDYIESDEVTFTVAQKTNDVAEVILYIDGECWNEKFVQENSIDTNEQSSITTVKERERPTSANSKRNNDEILSPTDNSTNRSSNVKRQKSDSEVNTTTTTAGESRRGTLTYIDREQPIVVLQLLPESVSILERIDDLITTLLDENQHSSTYNIGDYVIAQFSKDENYYRARIESSSSTTNECFTVYFLDYGNTEDNVRKDQLYSYSDELKSIPPLAQKYSLDRISASSWVDHVRTIVEKYENETIDFVFVDPTNSIIRLKFNDEIGVYNQPKTFTANICGTYKDRFYIHILPDSDALVCEIVELIQAEKKEVEGSTSWKFDDLCLVYDSERDEHFRGRILSINEGKYHVQCIDYGHVLSDLSSTNLYRIINDELREKSALARACRLHGVDDNDQIKAIDEIIRYIDPMERVTITVDNDQNTTCMVVMLFRENNETVNDRFIRQDHDLNPKTVLSANSSDSAIAADDDTSNDQQVASPIGAPQAESTHQFSDTTNLTVNTINQTIDFGENDPSSSNTTIKDDHENNLW